MKNLKKIATLIMALAMVLTMNIGKAHIMV